MGMNAMPAFMPGGLVGAGPVAQWNAAFQKAAQAIKAASATAAAG
jgi:hypothetical protein